jgi:hypothetical protein
MSNCTVKPINVGKNNMSEYSNDSHQRGQCFFVFCRLYPSPHTDKKENQIFLIYKEIQNGAVAKSYMTNGLLIFGEIFALFLIY